MEGMITVLTRERDDAVKKTEKAVKERRVAEQKAEELRGREKDWRNRFDQADKRKRHTEGELDKEKEQGEARLAKLKMRLTEAQTGTRKECEATQKEKVAKQALVTQMEDIVRRAKGMMVPAGCGQVGPLCKIELLSSSEDEDEITKACPDPQPAADSDDGYCSYSSYSESEEEKEPVQKQQAEASRQDAGSDAAVTKAGVQTKLSPLGIESREQAERGGAAMGETQERQSADGGSKAKMPSL
jgi:hypothetical protein